MSEAKIDEFPCIFPASTEFSGFQKDPFFIDSKNSETSSHLTLPSSRESTNFRFLSIPPAADRGGLVLPLPMSGERAVKPVGPEMCAARRVDQLRADAHAAAGPTRTNPRNRCLSSAELNVRIQLPPAESQRTFGSS